MGTWLSWTGIKTGAAWPAVVAHGAMNGSAGVLALFTRNGVGFDTTRLGFTVGIGWIFPALEIVVIRRRSGFSPPTVENSIY